MVLGLVGVIISQQFDSYTLRDQLHLAKADSDAHMKAQSARMDKLKQDFDHFNSTMALRERDTHEFKQVQRRSLVLLVLPLFPG